MASDRQLLENDIAARADALLPDRSFIVQAPAGSGKTELLIQRYLCLLARVDRPEEVLAITFTRKAAQEMKNRIIAALRKARDGVAAVTRHEQLTLDLAAAALGRSNDMHWQIIESPARMRIETVDAFCAGLARSLPVTSGLGGITRTVADAEMTNVYRAAATATLDHLAIVGSSSDAVARVLTHLDNNVGLYVAYLARMLASREQWLDITGSGGLRGAEADRARTRLERNIEDVISRQLELLDALVPTACREELVSLLQYAGRNLLEEGNTDHRLARFADTPRLPGADAAGKDGWHGIANLLLTQKGDWRRQATRTDGFPPGGKEQKRALADFIESLHDEQDLQEQLDLVRSLPEPRYTDDQWEVLLALFDLLPLAVSELKRLFSERAVCDHNEVAMAARRALGDEESPTDLALMLDYRIRHLLIDEMQDTSISQYELLRKLTAGWTRDDGRTVFCVGDPMQSIYRFRDAEVGEFLLARERGIGDTPLDALTLRRNFRSGEHLVHWFNDTFERVMPPRDDVAAGAIAYSASVPVEAGTGVGRCTVYPMFDALPDDEAGRTIDVITACLGASDDEDVAVLVRSRTQLTGLLARLRTAGIEYEAVEIDRLTDLPEIGDLLALVRALCHHGDRLAWLALLRGPYAGLRWDDILALVVNDRERTVPTLMLDEARIGRMSTDGRRRLTWLRERLRPYLVATPTSSLVDRAEKAWHSLGGPVPLDADQVNNVYRFFEALAGLESGGTVPDVAELEQRLDEERVSSSPGRCRLKVMTMHKAKGLEFPHVVLPALGRITRGGTREVLSWLNLPDAEGASEMIISPVGPRAALENDSLHQFIEATGKEKDRLELDRLLYVACTRAMKSLHLVGSVAVAPDGESFRRPDTRSLLSRLWPAVVRDYEAAFGQWQTAGAPDATAATQDPDSHLVRPVLKRFRESFAPPAVPGLPASARRTLQPDAPSADAVEYAWVGAAARHAGTIVHRWLQRLSTGRLQPAELRGHALDAATRRWASELGVPGDELDGVVDRVGRAVEGLLGDEKGRWIVDGEGASELAVTGVHDGRLQSVVIDRVRIDGDGVHWIIDYKTSTHEGGDLPGFLAQESDRYRDQLSRYAAIYSNLTGEPVKSALYFPMLREFVEVETNLPRGNPRT